MGATASGRTVAQGMPVWLEPRGVPYEGRQRVQNQVDVGLMFGLSQGWGYISIQVTLSLGYVYRSVRVRLRIWILGREGMREHGTYLGGGMPDIYRPFHQQQNTYRTNILQDRPYVRPQNNLNKLKRLKAD